MLLLLLSVAAWAGCDPASLGRAIDEAETAFGAMSDDIDTWRSRVASELACQTAPMDRALAGRVHRAHALFAFLDGDGPSASAFFARYRQIVPDADLPESLAPREHPLRAAFVGALPPPGSLPGPRLSGGGYVVVDGERDGDVPVSLPWLRQDVRGGSVTSSQIVQAGSGGGPGPVGDPPPPRERRPVRATTVAGLIAVGAGAGLYSAAFGTRSSYERAVAAGDADAIRSNHRATNGLVIAGLGLGVAGAGVTVSGLL